MDRICWSEKSIPLRSVVDNSTIQKPALAQIGTKSIIIGDKINGQFIMASPCKVSGDRFDIIDKEIVLSSKHTGIWKVISKSESIRESHIHRLTTKDIERIHKQDVRNERPIPRSYICTRTIEAFELNVRHSDPTITTGQRIDKRLRKIEEHVEFIIHDTGEVEYTPTEGERTSQDYVMAPKNKASSFLQRLRPNSADEEPLLRNRILRSLSCTTKNETHKRRFNLEVNEESCDIRPVASEGSTELRYLHSTQNLFEYMLTYGNDTILFVKLLRGDLPAKAIEYDGYMVFKSTLNGDKIPVCRVDDLEISLVNPDLPVKVRLPTGGHTWRSLSEIRAAELQCMQFSLSLLARHESEMYVTVEDDKNTSHFLQLNYNQEQKALAARPSPDVISKHVEECEKIFGSSTSKLTPQNDLRTVQSKSLTSGDGARTRKQQTSIIPESPKITRVVPSSHVLPEKLNRNEEKRVIQSNHKLERQRSEQGDKDNQTIIRHKLTPIDQESPKVTRAFLTSHPASDKLYRDEEKRVVQNNHKPERQRSEQVEKDNQTNSRNKPTSIGQESPKIIRVVPSSHLLPEKLNRNEEKRVIQSNHKSERPRSEQGDKDNQTLQTNTRKKPPPPSSSSSTSLSTITKQKHNHELK